MRESKILIPGRIAFVILLVTLPLASFGQKRELKTVVLNDGSRLTGTIVADSSGYLKLRIRTPQVITLDKSDVSLTAPARKSDLPLSDMHGYSVRLSASVLAGRTVDGNTGSLSFHFSNGYRFRNGLSIGAGTGLEVLDFVLLPVYADVRYQPFKSQVSPYAWIKSGYGFPVEDRGSEQSYYYGTYHESRGGFMFNAGTGIAIYSWQQTAFNIGIGYRYQKISYIYVNPWAQGTNNEIVTYFNRIEVQFGFIFR